MSGPDPRAPVALLVVGAALVALGVTQDPVATEPGSAHPIEGVSLVAPRQDTPPERMEAVAELGAGWVAVVPYAFVDPATGGVRFDRPRQHRGEREAGIRRQIDQARLHGLEVLLKPHLWVRGVGWAGEYAPESASAGRSFEEGYRDYVLAMAELAEELDVEMLAVGTELSRLVDERPDLFAGLIRDVREVYGGSLTYAANWDAYRRVPFWTMLDYVGIDAYFPLSSRPRPEVDELVAAWSPLVRELGELSEDVGRPVLFTEFGYRSMLGAAGEQWTLPDVRRTDPGRADHRVQADAYEALFRTWWGRSWFAGGFLWKWYLETPGRDGGERVFATGYTPQEKPTLEVIRRWWKRDDEVTR